MRRFYGFMGVLLLAFSSLCRGDSDCESNEKLKRWAIKLDAEPKYACIVIAQVDEHVRQAQNNITDIASSAVGYYKKIGDNGLIESTVQSSFTSGSSIIQVTRLNQGNRPPKEYFIRTYLQSLANLSHDGVFTEVQLEYDQDNMKLITLAKSPAEYGDRDTYMFEIQAWQYFQGCNEDSGCYRDKTDKRFIVKLVNAHTNPQVKIEQISAKDTLAYDYLQKNSKRLLGND